MREGARIHQYQHQLHLDMPHFGGHEIEPGYVLDADDATLNDVFTFLVHSRLCDAGLAWVWETRPLEDQSASDIWIEVKRVLGYAHAHCLYANARLQTIAVEREAIGSDQEVM